jgi:hypothetical protein
MAKKTSRDYPMMGAQRFALRALVTLKNLDSL